MVILRSVFVLSLLAALHVTAEEASPKSTHIWSLYDSTDHQFQNNTLNYDEFNRVFIKDGFYKFSTFSAGFNHYSTYPTLVVYQPVSNVNQLHGYYFPNGILSLLAYRADDPDTFELYRPVREYFLNSSTEAVTPYSAKFTYPYFYEYNLVKFVHVGEEVSTRFAVVFVAPTQVRKSHNDYKEVVKYYNDGKTNVIKEEIVQH